MAQTTEAELDSGRWSKGVQTAKGHREFTLALPALLEPVGQTRPHKPGIPDRRVMERMLTDMQRAGRANVTELCRHGGLAACWGVRSPTEVTATG